MATAELYVNYSLHERFLHFCADIQEFHDLFSWHTAPLRDWRIPLATGVVYTLIVLLWAWRRPPPPEKGSFEAERQAVIDKNTDLILKPFLGPSLSLSPFCARPSPSPTPPHPNPDCAAVCAQRATT